MNGRRFQLAPMSRAVWLLTLGLWALPVAAVVYAVVGRAAFAAPALLAVAIYAWVWLRFRPTEFVVHPDRLEVVWPLKRREIPRGDITAVRVVDRHELRREIGWAVRVGAGGLWGAFGWLWTRRRGIVQMYISRTDGFVWIERVASRPWLITPTEPEAFVGMLPGRDGRVPTGD